MALDEALPLPFEAKVRLFENLTYGDLSLTNVLASLGYKAGLKGILQTSVSVGARRLLCVKFERGSCSPDSLIRDKEI